MIVIVSEATRERAALGALFESRAWLWSAYDSLRHFKRALRLARPRVVVTRHRVSGGFSDEIIATLKTVSPATKIIVLAPAGFSTPLEARQVAVGADLVVRDPVRVDVLMEYVAKYLAIEKTETPGSELLLRPFAFAGAQVYPIERELACGKKKHPLTPREIQLIELLVETPDRVVTYETLYLDMLGRRFRGDTSNLRVLLGKLCDSASKVRIDLRRWIEVIPKLGYRYRSVPMEEAPPR